MPIQTIYPEGNLIYRYPETARVGRDESEINATKAARNLHLPVFVITAGARSTLRTVHLGWVTGWIDAARVFRSDRYDAAYDECPRIHESQFRRGVIVSHSVVPRPNSFATAPHPPLPIARQAPLPCPLMPTLREKLYAELSHIPPGDTSMFGACQAAFRSTYASRRKMHLADDPATPRGVTMLGLVELVWNRSRTAWRNPLDSIFLRT